ncbi:MAG: citramalate synthase [Dehalococcoidia bacterium]|nr:citramalate synthase [Dehalococcoidia bacterium]MSQ34531.1 citramalate synthase [Dehalococcoidia bacterium]
MDRQVELYDTTLRDGTQQEGISLSVEDKLAITQRLDELGVQYIEGGYAGANPKDDEYFRRVRTLKLRNAQVAAFGNTRRAGAKVAEDPSIKALLDSGAPVVTIVGKASEFQVKKVLGTSLEENLAMIADSVTHLKAQGRRVFFDAEHFFDGYKSNPDYALQALRVAADAGAERLVLCDTNGGTLPDEVGRITAEVGKALGLPGGAAERSASPSPAPDGHPSPRGTGAKPALGIHTHNDTDTAVAAALAGWQAGALQIQGTVNGYGERTGNANLISIIANLQLKLGATCVTDAQLASLTGVSRYVAEVVNRRPFPFQPFVGRSAFAHKGGLHAAAIEKSAQTYQHIPPEQVGNVNAVLVSELAGRGSVARLVRELGLGMELTDADHRRILKHVKDHEARGFSYEDADASFELVVRRSLPNYEPPFELVDFMVVVQDRIGRRGAVSRGAEQPGGGSALLSEATIKVRVGEQELHTAAEGNGPVSALDAALRKALRQFYPNLKDVRLTDYKVRVVNEGSGTGASVRVTIESADGGSIWRTVGASENIIEASWLALADSLEWWLVHNARER